MIAYRRHWLALLIASVLAYFGLSAAPALSEKLPHAQLAALR